MLHFYERKRRISTYAYLNSTKSVDSFLINQVDFSI